MLGTILIVVLILALLGALPRWYTAGSGATGGVGSSCSLGVCRMFANGSGAATNPVRWCEITAGFVTVDSCLSGRTTKAGVSDG
jgi:uncharacterized protein DUF3309